MLGLVLLVPAILLSAGPALAHTGGTGTGASVSELPGWVLWATGAGVVGLSFLLVGGFLSRSTQREPGPADPVDPGDVVGLPRRVVTGLRLVALFYLLAVLAPAVLPWRVAASAPTMVWIGIWVGLPIACALVGNVWLVVSPFRALAGLADQFRGGWPAIHYPEELGTWPTTVGVLAVTLLEISGAATAPVALARIAIAYTVLTLAGMAVFGSRTWLANAELFDRVFAWWSSFAPGRLTSEGIRWRWPGAELAERRAGGIHEVGFVLALLFAVNLDGFLATGLGRSVHASLGGAGSPLSLAATAVLGYLLFAAAFAGAILLVRAIARSLRPLPVLAGRIAPMLIPIALGYHLAHNLPYLVTRLPTLFGALIDPFGFGGALPEPLSLPGGWAPWLLGLQMGFIVVGHVAAVVVAHGLAFRAFPSRIQAAKSELPVTLVMILYTFVGLWTVSQGHALGGL